jgi:hypothetical protein
MRRLAFFFAALTAAAAFPAASFAGSTLQGQLLFGQITPSTDNGEVVTLVNGILQLRNVGHDATEGLTITQQASLPAFGLTFPLASPYDPLFPPTIQPGETVCFGLGGYVPYHPDTGYQLSATVTASNSNGNGTRTLTSGAWFDEETGMVGHVLLPGWFSCPGQ